MRQQITVVGLKRHAYAPELNLAVLSNGKVAKAPGCMSIKEAQEHVELMCKPKPLYAVRDSNGNYRYTPVHPTIRMYG